MREGLVVAQFEIGKAGVIPRGPRFYQRAEESRVQTLRRYRWFRIETQQTHHEKFLAINFRIEAPAHETPWLRVGSDSRPHPVPLLTWPKTE